MKKIDFEKPILFYNSKEEDRKAYFLLMESNIPCDYRPPSEEPTPLLLVGFRKYVGLQEIKGYLTMEEFRNSIKEK